MASFPYRVTISPNVISQEVLLGETVLMNVETLAYFGLDELGSKIWRELSSCNDAQEAFDRVSKDSGVDGEKLAATFNGILRGLEMSKIISLENRG